MIPFESQIEQYFSAAQYQLHYCVGKGGQSVVFKATDWERQCDVALKFLRPDVSTHHVISYHPLEKQRFQQECERVASVLHPQIIRCLAWIEQGVQCEVLRSQPIVSKWIFGVFEWHPGVTLETLIRQQGTLSLPLTFDLMKQLLQACDYLHQRGIAHGDLKPANLMIDWQGESPELTLIDFGQSQAISSCASSSDAMMFNRAMSNRCISNVGTPNRVTRSQPESAQHPLIHQDLLMWGHTLMACLTGKLEIGAASYDLTLQSLNSRVQFP